MAAATEVSEIAKRDPDRELRRLLRRAGDDRAVIVGRSHSVYYEWSVKTTNVDDANDRLQLYKFPVNAVLESVNGFVGDLDGGSAHVASLTLDDTNLVTGITSARAGGVLLTGTQAATVSGTDVSGKTLEYKTTTAAGTPTAGTLSLHISFWVKDTR